MAMKHSASPFDDFGGGGGMCFVACGRGDCPRHRGRGHALVPVLELGHRRWQQQNSMLRRQSRRQRGLHLRP